MDEHTLNDLLECSVCLERLDTSSKVLPCQHTFCRKCLEVIVSSRQELRCPECRILVDIKIDDLPPNVLLMRILEGMKNAAAAAKIQESPEQESQKLQNEENKIEELHKIQEEQQQQQQQQQQIKLKQQQQQQQQKQFLQYQQQQKFQQLQHKQQIALQQQQHAVATSNSASIAFQRRCLVPHAYALYDFEPNESSDLKFKKGDLVLLKRRLDVNWYVGQVNGSEGTFPINYVQVIIPLPTSQCIALYDFKMGPNEEEGCLTFQKGTVIHVLRRVDHNWAEGRIGTSIGIFPIAFVELNAMAKQLLDSFTLLNSTPAPAPPPLSSSVAMANVTSTVAKTPLQKQQQNAIVNVQSQPRNLPPIPIQLDPTVNLNCSDSTSSSSSPNTTSPNSNTTTCSSNSSSNSITSSPNQSLPNTPQHTNNSVRYRDGREKRHSLNALLSAGAGVTATPALSILQTNRHSAEILSIPTTDIVTAANTSANSLSSQNLRIRNNIDVGQSTVTNNISTGGPAVPQTTAAREQQQQSVSTSTLHSRVNVLKTGGQQNIPPTLPWGYLALYPYKPRKNDELELKKGCVYVVIERCLDGWFKGKNWQDISGVFPGNYVTPLRNRDQQQLMHQWKFVPPQNVACATTHTQTNINQNLKSSNHIDGLNICLTHPPPDLPPRHVMNSQSNQTTIGSVCTKPLTQAVEAFFNRSTVNKSQNATTNDLSNANDTKEKENKQKDVNLTCSSSSSSVAVNLMKRLASIKSRSKSPSTAIPNNLNILSQTKSSQANINYSMDNPTFEDAGSIPSLIPNTAYLNNSQIQAHPIHVRSGSCPSQLLQNIPMDLQTLQMNDNKQNQQQQQNKQQPSQVTYGSQRIKGCKERPNLQNVRKSVDETLRTLYNSNIGNNQTQQQQPQPQPQHQEATTSCNMLLTKCSQQLHKQQHQINMNPNIIQHRKSQSLDANTMTCSMPTPVTSTATIVGNAALKPAQNARESRFRCVVPYPPNSDIELELQLNDIIYVHRKLKNGWYKGICARTNKTGLFPASFVEPDL